MNILGVQIVGVLFSIFMVYVSFLNWKKKDLNNLEMLFWLFLWIFFIIIVLFLGACVAFIIYSQGQTWSLVEEDYYPKELRYEEKLVKMRN